MTAGSRSRALGALFSLAFLFPVSCLWDDDGLVPETLRLTGTCAAGETRIVLTQDERSLSLAPDRATRLPLSGALTPDGSFRQGDFTLAGEVCLDEAAPTISCDERRRRFVACIAERLDWQLRLRCYDGDAAPVCEGLLDEL